MPREIILLKPAGTPVSPDASLKCYPGSHLFITVSGKLITGITGNNDGTSVNITRNAAWDIVSITDEANRTVLLERDIMGRVIKETAPSGRIVRYEWGASGCESCGSEKKLTKIIDSGNKQWEFKYDTMGNVIEMIYPDLSKIEQRFDVAGRLEWFKNKRGQETGFEYDADGRLLTKTTPEGGVDFTYDDRDRLTEVSGPGYHYKYDYGVAFVGGNSPLVKETNLENGLWVQHIYDTNGLPQRYYDSFLWEKGYQYNFTSGTGTPIGFTPIKVWYAKKGIGTTYNTEYKHDPMGRLRNKLNTFFGTEEWYTYDSKGLLQQILYRQYPNMSGSFPTVTLDLQRDPSGLITGLTGAKQLSASFNPDLEITAVQHTAPTPFTEAYSYDPRGNRLSSLSNTFSYNDINQLTESATHTYTYDADGNLIQERNKATGETKKYFYNSENQLTGYEHYANEFTSVDQTAQYTYDLYGRRIQKTINGIVTNFLWDEDNISLELNENNQPIRRYVYGVGMDNVEGHFEHAEATSNPFATDKKGWYTYIKDQVGTVYKTFSHERQDVSNTKTYDVLGNIISQTGSSPSSIGFQGKYHDRENELVYFYNRYYHPKIGRFMVEDMILNRKLSNMYYFASNNPLNNIDPLGLRNVPISINPAYYYEKMLNFYGIPENEAQQIITGGKTVTDDISNNIINSLDNLSNISQSIIYYDYCYLYNCVKDDTSLMFGLSLSFVVNSAIYFASLIQPELNLVMLQIRYGSMASDAIVFGQLIDRINKCYKRCKR